MAVSDAVAALLTEYKRFAGTEMNDLFAADGERAQKYTLTLGDLTYDYSKTVLTPACWRRCLIWRASII